MQNKLNLVKTLKILFLKLIHKLLKNDEHEERLFFLLTIVTGIASGLVAVFLHKVTHFLTKAFGTGEQFDTTAFIAGGIAVLLSGFLTTRFFPSTSGSGIPQVQVALAVYHGKIKFGSTLAKLLTSILSLSSGMSIGREGPTVGISAGIGSAIGNFFSLSKKRVKSLVAVGSAGGIAAAFHTPISAVVFTLEEVVGDLNAKMLGSIVISSVVASITAQVLTGKNAAFAAVHYHLSSPWELILYIIIGIAAAFTSVKWMKMTLYLRKFNLQLFRGHRLTLIMITFILIGLASHINPNVLGSGHSTAEETLLSLIFDWKVLIVLFVLKFFATSLSFSSGISGGLFMPTLLIGAILGSLFGAIYNGIFPEYTAQSGAYALVGMGAYFAGVLRAPITSILMVFELTRDYNIILPLMISNMISYFLSSRLHKGSIYENLCEQDGIHLPKNEDNEVLESLLVEDAMKKDPIKLTSGMTIKECYRVIKDTGFSGFPIMHGDHLAGMVSSNDIKAQMAKENFEAKISSICEKKIISIYKDQSLLVALHKLRKYHISRLPVVSRINDKDLIGIITAEDIVSHFGYHVTSEDDDENIINKEKIELLKKLDEESL